MAQRGGWGAALLREGRERVGAREDGGEAAVEHVDRLGVALGKAEEDALRERFAALNAMENFFEVDAVSPRHPDAIGDYRILGKLGEGGMALVFEAEQQHPRRKVALKLVRGDLFLDDAQVKMFQREAEALGPLVAADRARMNPQCRAEHEQTELPIDLGHDRLGTDLDRLTTGVRRLL